MASIITKLARLTLATTSRLPVSSFHSSAPLFRGLRDIHRTGVKFERGDSAAFEGLSSNQSYVAVNTANISRHLPLPETMKQQFNGIPYEELPIVYIKATKNNTLMHATDYKVSIIIINVFVTIDIISTFQSNTIMYTSCRNEGFKNARKKTTIAGQTTGVAAGQRLLRRGINTVRIIVKGIGPGRASSVQGLATAGVKVISITDRTPLIELGPRPRKMRRV